MSDANEIIPFGKYRGQPIDVLHQDPQYCDWLMSQSWLEQRYPSLRTIIINNFSEPEETPEHNALQVRLLDDAFVLAVLHLVDPKIAQLPLSTTARLLGDIEVIFEVCGADAVIRGLRVPRVEVLREDCGPDRFDELCWREARYRDDPQASFSAWAAKGVAPVYVEIPTAGVELKPSMGDDYPAVLRQVHAMNGRSLQREIHPCVLIVGDYNGRGATLEQVRKLMEKSRVHLLMTDEVDKVARKISEFINA